MKIFSANKFSVKKFKVAEITNDAPYLTINFDRRCPSFCMPLSTCTVCQCGQGIFRSAGVVYLLGPVVQTWGWWRCPEAQCWCQAPGCLSSEMWELD